MAMYEPPYHEADQAALTASDMENIVSPNPDNAWRAVNYWTEDEAEDQ